jgi:hypothetical protein
VTYNLTIVIVVVVFAIFLVLVGLLIYYLRVLCLELLLNLAFSTYFCIQKKKGKNQDSLYEIENQPKRQVCFRLYPKKNID